MGGRDDVIEVEVTLVRVVISSTKRDEEDVDSLPIIRLEL